MELFKYKRGDTISRQVLGGRGYYKRRVTRFPKIYTVVGVILYIFTIYMRKVYIFYVFLALLTRRFNLYKSKNTSLNKIMATRSTIRCRSVFLAA